MRSSMNWISRTSEGVASTSSAPLAASPAGRWAELGGIPAAATATHPSTDSTMARTCFTDRLVPSMRIKKRPSIGLVRNMSGQHEAQLFQGLELVQLPLHKNFRDRPDISRQILLNGDDRRLPGRSGGAKRSLPGGFLPLGGWCRGLPPEARSCPLPPLRQKLAAIPRIAHLTAEQIVKLEDILRLACGPPHRDRSHRADECR